MIKRQPLNLCTTHKHDVKKICIEAFNQALITISTILSRVYVSAKRKQPKSMLHKRKAFTHTFDYIKLLEVMAC